MLKSKLTQIAIIATASSAIALANPDSKEKQQAETRSLMAQIFTGLTEVLPLSFDTKEFERSENRDKIMTNLGRMRDASNALVDHTKSFEGSYGYIASSMSRDLRDIATWYSRGATSESRYLLHQVSENCASCHMKLPDPGHAPRMDQFFKTVQINSLSQPEKARLQVALRQFDDAMSTWESFFKTWEKPREIVAMDSLPEYLKVAIRVKGDSQRASNTIDGLMKDKGLPQFMAREMEAWQKSLASNASELTKPGNELKRAEKLINSSRQTMEYPMDRRGYVDYLIASSLLNKFLQSKNVTPEKKSEAYYYLGITEALTGRSTWLTQTDFYFESAVRAAPHSKIASKAFDALEQQILLEYSGSGGTNIPEDVKTNIDELKRLMKK